MNESLPFMAALLASILHVLTGPDHLAAVTPFAIKAKRLAWKVGLMWSIGHLLGMLLLGILFYWFREAIPIEKISKHAELLVGVTLIGIGLWALYRLFVKSKKHQHLHVHIQNKPIIHSHSHDHDIQANHDHEHDLASIHDNGLIPAFGIGVLHGVAGIGHLILFLPMLGFPSDSGSLQYLLGFAIGIIIAMVLYSLVIGRLSGFAANGHHRMFFSGIRLSAGLFAIIIGIYWILAN